MRKGRCPCHIVKITGVSKLFSGVLLGASIIVSVLKRNVEVASISELMGKDSASYIGAGRFFKNRVILSRYMCESSSCIII